MKDVKTVLFREDNSLRRKVVVKANGKPEYYCNCVVIDGNYYCRITEVDFISGNYYVKGTVALEYDWEKKCDVAKHEVGKMLHGIVSCDGNKPVYGYFTPNKFSNVSAVLEGEGLTILNHVVAAKNGFQESYAHNIFYKFKNDLQFVSPFQFDYKQYSYSSDDDAKRFQLAIDTYAKANFPFCKDMKVFYPFVKKYTYGLEFEICSGYLPQRLLDGFGVLPCRDGSVNHTNGELVTVPYTGTKGISTVYYLTKELQKRCTVDLSCSMHIHFSGFPKSRIFTLTLYTLMCKIQDELFEMFPHYKKDPSGVKKKNYTQMLTPLPTYSKAVYGDFKTYVNKMYYTLFHKLSDGKYAGKEWNTARAEHPQKVKWERPSR